MPRGLRRTATRRHWLEAGRLRRAPQGSRTPHVRIRDPLLPRSIAGAPRRSGRAGKGVETLTQIDGGCPLGRASPLPRLCGAGKRSRFASERRPADCSYWTISRISAPSTMSSPVMFGTRHRVGPGSPRGRRAPPGHLGDAARRVGARLHGVPLWRVAQCCMTTRRSPPPSSSDSSAKRWASTSCSGSTSPNTVATARWCPPPSPKGAAHRKVGWWGGSPAADRRVRPAARRPGPRVHVSVSVADHRRPSELPREDYPQFQRWSISLLSITVNRERAWPPARRWRQIFMPILAARRRTARRPDQQPAQAEIEGEKLRTRRSSRSCGCCFRPASRPRTAHGEPAIRAALHPEQLERFAPIAR